ncbi:MAG: 2-oxo-hepta-3-ene-1,7-dioic acid hydratase [Pseudomonadota bacterium]
MTPEEQIAAAKDLIAAEKTGQQIGLLSLQYPGMTLDDAYGVQKAIIDAKIADGCRVIGWKIGLTSRAMQAALGIETPDSGALFDDMLFDNGAIVPKGRFIQPRVEAEIAFVMKAPVEKDATRDDLLAAIDFVAPSLEILDTRILRNDPASGTPRIITDTVSDNAANAGLVLGPERWGVDDHDLRWVGAIAARNGVVEETGLGAGVLNDPVESVLWLAKRMDAYGQRIEAGEVILSGSFIRPIECPPGSEIDADFGPFGSVRVSFA